MYIKSLKDKLSESLYPAYRKLEDLKIDFTGSKSLILKIEKIKRTNQYWRDNPDDKDKVLVEFINNAQIDIPGGIINLYQKRDNVTLETDISAIDLEDLIPITMTIKFGGNVTEDNIKLQKGDIIGQIYYGDSTTKDKIVILFEVEKIQGHFIGKFLTKKLCQLSLYRGTLYDDFEIAIEKYINNVVEFN